MCVCVYAEERVTLKQSLTTHTLAVTLLEGSLIFGKVNLRMNMHAPFTVRSVQIVIVDDEEREKEKNFDYELARDG